MLNWITFNLSVLGFFYFLEYLDQYKKCFCIFLTHCTKGTKSNFERYSCKLAHLGINFVIIFIKATLRYLSFCVSITRIMTLQV